MEQDFYLASSQKSFNRVKEITHKSYVLFPQNKITQKCLQAAAAAINTDSESDFFTHFVASEAVQAGNRNQQGICVS